MKRRTIWEVNTREALTIKRHTMVTTNQEVEDDVKDAPPIFEEGIQATIEELKPSFFSSYLRFAFEKSFFFFFSCDIICPSFMHACLLFEITDPLT